MEPAAVQGQAAHCHARCARTRRTFHVLRGPTGFCPPGQKCTDAANLECNPGSECVRMSALYWQCHPKAADDVPGMAGRRLQATKAEGPTPSMFGPLPGPKACTDSQYLDCAFDTSRCVRLSHYFWQCRPLGAPSLTNISGGLVLDYAWCGGIGDLCPFSNRTRCNDSAVLDCQLTDSKCTRVSKW
ncbi:hypothetical protein WJX75_007356 [Coccomyxa subellipsoidea]|uniref:CBM1 domain-containing protein n=1 Tax=Coccomyxa subellipsoidea TaxID=248742 RepID=A0ABR2YLM1_9CHLO